MAQKFVTEADALACAVDQAGNIGNNKGIALSHINNAQIRRKRGKVVIRYLRLSLRNHGNKA